jgi:hypothetical protein
MRNMKCTRCGEVIIKAKHLELSITDGNYYVDVPNGHESSGYYPFGLKCATSELRQTIDSLCS